MELRSVLRCLVGLMMVGGFLAQMWNLFDQFVSGLMTVAISYEDKSTMEFPSFAFCDSRAFMETSVKIANAARYNATAINLENEVKLTGIGMTSKDGFSALDDWQKTYTAEHVPTIFNGNCMLFEFYRDYPINTWACK